MTKTDVAPEPNLTESEVKSPTLEVTEAEDLVTEKATAVPVPKMTEPTVTSPNGNNEDGEATVLPSSISPSSPASNTPATVVGSKLSVPSGTDEHRKSSFDDIIGRYDTYQRKLRDGTLTFEDESSSLKTDGELETESIEQDKKRSLEQSENSDQPKQRPWSLRKSLRYFWRTSGKGADGPDVAPVTTPEVKV